MESSPGDSPLRLEKFKKSQYEKWNEFDKFKENTEKHITNIKEMFFIPHADMESSSEQEQG